MTLLKVVIIGTSPVETLQVEEALLQTGCLDSFRYIGLEQALDNVPDWDEWDLVFARYYENTGGDLLSLLSPVLREAALPTIFLIDGFDPQLVTRLMNAGAVRVLPASGIEQLLKPALTAIIEKLIDKALPAPGPSQADGSQAGADFTVLPDSNLSRIFYSSPMGLCVNRLEDGRCIDCNDAFSSLLESSRVELIGTETPEVGSIEEIRNAAGQDSAGLWTLSERKIFTRGRNVRYIQVQQSQVDWQGIPCVLSIVLDMTEKEEIKEKLNRVNEDLERMVQVRTSALEAANYELEAEIGHRKELENLSNQLTQIIWEMPDIVYTLGPDMKLRFLNRAGRRLFGLGETAPLHDFDILSVYPEEMHHRFKDEINPVLFKEGIWRGETKFRLTDGRTIPLLQVFLCTKDDSGKVLYFASIAHDVSDFKAVEQALRQSREHYRMLAEAAHDLIFMIDKDGLMEYANRYACQAMGFEPDQIKGMPASQFFPTDFANNHLRMFYEVHKIDEPVYTEGPLKRGGKEFWLGTWLVPINSEEGPLSSVLGISRDITEQKKTDEALQRALENERRLSEMRNNFFSMTSHQFRTPLSSIILSTELLQKYGSRWNEEKRNECLGRIQKAAGQIKSMLDDILVIGRVESGKYICKPEEFDLIAFCGSIVEEMALNDQGNHELIFQHELDQMQVFLDPDVLRRVIDNLISNAIKYSEQGTPITISIEQEDEHVLIEVADQGIGIPDRDVEFIFQPFHRGSNSFDYPGTGIGLTIIQKSVELMNGSVSLKSKVGQGTTFMVRLPFRYEAALEDTRSSN